MKTMELFNPDNPNFKRMLNEGIPARLRAMAELVKAQQDRLEVLKSLNSRLDKLNKELS